MSQKQLMIMRVVLWIAAFTALLPLMAHLFAGGYNRPMVDDFCFAHDVQRLGVLGNVQTLYDTWTGTYSSSFFQGIIAAGHIWHLTPGLLFSLWFLALWVLLHQLLRITRLRSLSPWSWIPALVFLSATLVAVSTNGSYNIYQSVYWTSGAITYTLPLILFTFTLAVLVAALQAPEGKRQFPYLSLIAGLCMVAGGFSPLFAVVHVAAWFFLMLACWLFLPRSRRRIGVMATGTALIFAFIAFVIVAVSPGNAIRRETFAQEMPLSDVIIFSARMAVAFILYAPYLFIPLVLGAAAGGVYFWQTRVVIPAKKRLMIITLAIEVMFVLVFLGCFTAVFATDQSPPLRARIVMQYAVVILMSIIGLAGGHGLAQRLTRTGPQKISGSLRYGLIAGSVIAALVIGINLVQMTSHTLREREKLAVFAAEWDAVVPELEAAGPDDDVILQPFTHDLYVMSMIGRISENPGSNSCLRWYYGVRGVSMPAEDSERPQAG